MSEEQQEPIMTFPMDCEVKGMGKPAEDFEALVLSLVSQQVPDLGASVRRTSQSKNGTYLSVTVGFEAQSKEQWDAVHKALVDEPRVLYVL